MIHELYRYRRFKEARKHLIRITDLMASLKMEGLNRKAELIQISAYGFKKFPNYRLKFIEAIIRIAS